MSKRVNIAGDFMLLDLLNLSCLNRVANHRMDHRMDHRVANMQATGWIGALFGGGPSRGRVQRAQRATGKLQTRHVQKPEPVPPKH